MATYRDIDYNTRINGGLTVISASTFSDNLTVVGVLAAGDIEDVASAIKSKLSTFGGTISGNLTVTGDLIVEGSIDGIEMDDYYTKEDLQTPGQAQVALANIAGFSDAKYLKTDASNVLTATSHNIKIRPSASTTTQQTNKVITFDAQTKDLPHKPIDAMSEVVKSDEEGAVVYERDVDYSMDYFNGKITRLPDGHIDSGQTVYVDYVTTTVVFSIVNETDTSTFYSIDSRGNVFGKSISVILSSASSTNENDIQGDFTISGNLVVHGNLTLGDNSSEDVTAVIGDFNVHNGGDDPIFSVLHTDQIVARAPITMYNGETQTITLYKNGNVDIKGQFSINGTRKDNQWDAAYTHSTSPHAPFDAPSGTAFSSHTGDNAIHVSSSDRSNWNAAYSHSTSPHAPSDAPSGAAFTNHTSNTTIHITQEERDAWNHQHPYLSLSGGTINGNVKLYSPTQNQNVSLRIGDRDNDHGFSIIYNGTGDILEFWADNGTGSPVQISSVAQNGAINFLVAPTIYSNSIWHSGNLTPSNYLHRINGGTVTGNVTISGALALQNTLSVSGAITASSSLTVSGTLNTGVITTTNTNVVNNLNADRVDSFHAADIFNAAMDIGGYGIIYGCEVSQANPAAEAVSIAPGKVYIRNYGVFNFNGESSVSSGFNSLNHNIVYMRGDGVIGDIGVISASTLSSANTQFNALSNAIKLAYIPPYNKASILNADIHSTRKFMPIKMDTESQDKIQIFLSDDENKRVNPGNHQTIPRILIERSEDRTIFTLNDIPTAANVRRSLKIESDKITITQDQQSKTVTASQISAWDTAGEKSHTHYYNAEWSGPAADAKTITINSGHNLTISKTRVYKNGLRMKPNTNATAWDNDYWVGNNTVVFTNPVSTDDNIIVDYDL